MPARCYVGTSGWSYAHWRSLFYRGIPQSGWLEHYASQFDSVEINSSFYHLPKLKSLQHWLSETPESFVFTAKANRYITHTKRLTDCRPGVEKEKSVMAGLGDKLHVILWQLPASLHLNQARLQQLVSALECWPEVRHCIEFRHASWFIDAITELLQAHNIATCQSDAADWPLWQADSADFAYLRLHGHTQTYASSYRTSSLQNWAQQIRAFLQAQKDVYVYFDNDAEANAIKNARQLLELLD